MGQHHVRASCSTTLSAGPRPLPPLPIAPKHSGIGADGRVGREGFNYETEGLTFADFDVGVYWRPEVGGKILIGSIEPECDDGEHARVRAGLRFPELGCVFQTDGWLWVAGHHTFLGDADLLDTGFTEQFMNQVYRAALRMPSLPIPSAADTMGIVAMCTHGPPLPLSCTPRVGFYVL